MKAECLMALARAGISDVDAMALRRIAMTLHRWHELECGDGNDHGSWCITRGNKTKRAGGEFVHDEDGKPYLEYHGHTASEVTYTALPDREAGALKRLAKIMQRYPGFSFYVQGDPRGAPLYILKPGDSADQYSSRGIAVYK